MANIVYQKDFVFHIENQLTNLFELMKITNRKISLYTSNKQAFIDKSFEIELCLKKLIFSES